MKKILILFVALISLIATQAQEKIESIDSVYVAGAVKYVAPTYDNYYNGVNFYSGVAGFTFTVTNYVDTLTVLILEGGYDGTNFVPIDTLTELNGSKTYSLYQTPPVYHKYRLRAPLVSGDTATLKNITYFEKLPKLK